jgi:hypothetical protein
MKSIQLGGLTVRFKKIGKFFAAHSRMIYFVLFVCVLIGAILGLNLALYQPSDEEYKAQKLSETQSARFDTETIKKIQNLNAQQQTITSPIPTNQRVNPFGE